MILAAFISKAVISIIEKADDRRIARSFHKRLKVLEKYSHPQSDWICMKCGCNAKRVVNPIRRK